jgi:LCP family protein required for cell wall assembly
VTRPPSGPPGSLPPGPDPRGGQRHGRASGSKYATLGTLGKVIAALVSAALVVYIGILWTTVRGANDVPRVVVNALGGTSTAPDGKVTHRADIDGKDQNLLIVGNDDRSQLTNAQVKELRVGRDGGSLNTDSMMIVHVPADGSKATLISLPRDSYVRIPGYGKNKLNAAYALAYNDAHGGHDNKVAAAANELVETVQNLTGLNIDHFIQVTLLGFVTISDAVGGVSVNLCHGVNDTVKHNQSIGRSGGSGLVLSKGKHTIKGVQALEFVRQREGLPNGDLDRTARQRYFLTAAFRKVASAGTLLDPGKLRDLVSAVKKSIYVDSGLNMLDLARQMSNLSADNIVGQAIPFERFANTDVGSVEIVSPHRVQAFVKSLISGGTDTAAYQKAKTVDPSTVSVSVINAGSQDGAASTASGVLDKAGFKSSVNQSSPPRQDKTTIEYPAGLEAQAKTLAAYVPGAEAHQGNVSELTLTLGMDGLTAQKTPSSTGHAHHRKHHHKKKKSRGAVDAGCIN